LGKKKGVDMKTGAKRSTVRLSLTGASEKVLLDKIGKGLTDAVVAYRNLEAFKAPHRVATKQQIAALRAVIKCKAVERGTDHNVLERKVVGRNGYRRIEDMDAESVKAEMFNLGSS
jgi:hypothetical protein